MIEGGLTGKFKALVRQHGALMVIYVFLRTYWKAVAGVAGSCFAFGVFVSKFNTLIENQTSIATAIVALTARVGAVEKAAERKKDEPKEFCHGAGGSTQPP